jgi:hypothetical protein
MLQVWLDDSGKANPPVFVLAGYFAYADDWIAFAHRWQTLLDVEPRLKYIKAYEAFGLRGEFKGWEAGARDTRLIQFLTPIFTYCRLSVAFTVDHRHFADKRDPVWGFKNAYMFTYISALTGVLRFVATKLPHETIEIIFDNGVVHPKQAQSAYKELFGRLPKQATDRLARKEPRFEDDKDFNPLQAADLLAHCVRAKYDPNPLYERVRASPIYERLMERVFILSIDRKVASFKERVKRVRGTY